MSACFLNHEYYGPRTPVWRQEQQILGPSSIVIECKEGSLIEGFAYSSHNILSKSLLGLHIPYNYLKFSVIPPNPPRTSI
jgi:hypothetical protein